MSSSIVLGVHSPLEASLVEQLGGAGIWVSGFSISAACFGLPDEDAARIDDKLLIIERILKSSQIPAIVDIDSGSNDVGEFAHLLSSLSEMGAYAVCVEDERTPKVSALYESDQDLLTSEQFSERVAFVDERFAGKVIARTNGLVRGYPATHVCEKIDHLLNNVPEVSDVALHGDNPNLMLTVIEKYPNLNFSIIMTLLDEEKTNAARELRVDHLIFGHDLLFASIVETSHVARQLIQTGTSPVDRSAARHLIDTLVGRTATLSDISNEMLEYYNERAPEYEDWYDREGIYDKGETLNERWSKDVDHVASVLQKIESQSIIEFAAGTGKWTKLLARKNQILPTDASSKMLDENFKNTGIKGLIIDIYQDLPDALLGKFTACFFGFLISHVPRGKIEALFERIDQALSPPGGQVTILDSYYNPTELNCLSHSNDIQLRTLKDGRTFRVVKHYFTRVELETMADKYLADWSIEFTKDYFFILTGTRKL